MAEPSRRALAAYGAIAAPLAFAGFPLYIHAPDFFAVERGAPLAALGGVLAALRLADAAQDPLVGWAADRWPQARGWLVVLGALALGGGFVGLFAPPRGPVLLWFAAMLLLASFGHSLISVTLTMLGGLWRAEEAAKSRISAAREMFGLAGLILAVVLPGLLAPSMGREGALLALAGLLIAGLALTAPLFLRWRRATALALRAAPEQGGWRALTRLSGFYAVALMALLSAALPATLILMLVRDLLGAEALTGAFLLTYFVAALPGAALAGRLAGRFGAARVWGASLMLSILGFSAALLLGPGDAALFFAICAVTGLTFGADLALPPAILSERIGALGIARSAGRAYAALAFLTKASLALSGAIALPLLASVGFTPGGENAPGPLSALLALYAGVPLALRALAAGLLVWLARKGRL